MSRPKLGVVAQYLGTRTDVRRIVELLGERFDVVLFVRPGDPNGGVQGVEIRPISARRRSVRNQLLARAFLLFGRLPKSRRNYYITERWKAENLITTPLGRWERRTLLAASRVMPHGWSYDAYLDALDVSTTTAIGDIQTFLFFSEIYDDHFLAHVLRAGKRVFGYVYSWDHPPKMMRFSQRVERYLTWNEGLRHDLAELHDIPLERIIAVGSTQLAYIEEYRRMELLPLLAPSRDALYVGCAVGIPGVIEQEVAAIADVARAVSARAPEFRVVVRPYPFQAAWDVYAPLRRLPNVVFDDGFRDAGGGMGLDQRRIFERFSAIEQARAFLHFGTTMGLEAAYFDTPSLLGDFPSSRNGVLSLSDFVHQYQNDKYLNVGGCPNVVHHPERVADALVAMDHDERYRQYNRRVANTTPLRSFEQIRDDLAEVLS